jgi:ADP-ribose pyrophosphatase
MKFQLGKKKVIYKSNFVTLWGTEFIDKGGKSQEWEYIEKADAVAVLPITRDNKAILIKNYRVPVERYVLETPAGLLDKKGENLEDGVRRELLEETGYKADRIYQLPAWPLRSGISKNIIHGFIATGLEKVSDIVGDDLEDLSVVEIPLKDLVDAWLHPKDDAYFSLEIIAMYQAALALGIVK